MIYRVFTVTQVLPELGVKWSIKIFALKAVQLRDLFSLASNLNSIPFADPVDV